MKTNPRAAAFGRRMAFLARTQGSDIHVGATNGRVVKALASSLARRDREYLPEEGRNVADTDWMVFTVSPQAFPPALGRPVEAGWPPAGTLLFWHGVSYTLAGLRKADDAGVCIELALICYRTPQPPEADAGQLAIWTERLPTP